MYGQKQEAALNIVFYSLFVVSRPVIKIIGEEINGQEVIKHEKDVPYVDLIPNAEIVLADGTHRDVPVTTVLNTVPAICNTLGKYEVHYEATGPYGFTSQHIRHVQIGQFTL